MPQSRAEFFFDFRSPYSYLAHTQLATLGDAVTLRPMDLMAVMKAVGNSPTTIQCEAKGRYARVDLARWAALYRVPFERNRHMRDIDGGRLLRAVLAANRLGQAQAAVGALFPAVWANAAPLQSPAEIAEVLGTAGLDHAAIAPLVDDPELDGELDRASAEAAARGVFGAPTFIADEQMFFGNDRMDFLRQHLETTQ